MRVLARCEGWCPNRTIRAETINASWVVQMSATVIEFENSAAASFPKGTDTHWITENRILWNQEHRKPKNANLSKRSIGFPTSARGGAFFVRGGGWKRPDSGRLARSASAKWFTKLKQLFVQSGID